MIDTTYNGLSIYEEIGFIGLNVIGRKTINVDISSRDNAKDGTTYQSKKLPERELIVQGFIEADSEEELLEKYDRLMGFLVKDPVQIIFSDEPDKYFVGMYKAAKIAKEGRTANTTELYFNCNDPHKYSTYRKEFNAANGGIVTNTDGTITVKVQNDGTVAAPISYEMTMNHENGYVGIASESGAMEFGDIEEADKTTGTKSQTLVNYTGGQAIYNALDKTKCITTANHALNGSFKVTDGYLTYNSVGSGSGWHGAGGQITLSTACSDFKCSFKPYYATHLTYVQVGLIEIVVGDESGKLLCDVHLVKSGTGNNYARCKFKVTGSNVEYDDVYGEEYACWGYGGDPNTGGWTNEGSPEIWFSKAGDKFEICFHGKKHSFRVPAASAKKAKTLNVFIGSNGSTTPMTFMRIKNLKFVRNNVSYYYDLPNRYQEGDVLKIDGEEGMFYVNGNEQAQDEVLGTTYIKAKPKAETELNVSVSSFCSPKPTVKAYIREAWL